MTRMIPDTIHPGIQSQAERKLFHRFKTAPGTESWVCLHSLGLARHSHKRRGEIDYLLLTPHGFFVLEVKGGRVKRERGVWTFTNREGRTNTKYEGPFEQASSAMFTLEQELLASPEVAHHARVLYGVGVMFPDITFDACTVDADPRQVYDWRDTNLPLTQYVRRLADFSAARDKRERRLPNQEDIEAVTNFLRGDFDCVPSLGWRLTEARDQLLSLTEQQYLTLDLLEERERIIVQGGAGTGKTLLAMQSLRREAARGGRGLYLCHNRLLALQVETELRQEGAAYSNLQARTLFGVMKDIIASSPLARDFEEARRSVSDKELFEVVFPDFFERALQHLEEPIFDLVIVDEAQDVLHSTVEHLMEKLLAGGMGEGRWRIFLDSNNQAGIYQKLDRGVMHRFESQSCGTLLMENCRNTTCIVQETEVLTQPRLRTRARLEGEPVTRVYYQDRDEARCLVLQFIHKLLDGDVSPSSITLLSARSYEHSVVSTISNADLPPGVALRSFEEVASRHWGGHEEDTVTWSTVSAFKGLENDVIILTDIESVEGDWWQSVLYVGMTRARHNLTVLLHKSLDGAVQELLRQHFAKLF